MIYLLASVCAECRNTPVHVRECVLCGSMTLDAAAENIANSRRQCVASTSRESTLL